jgi:glycosyltransferase involved in cell wall biosynthesis
VFSWTDEWHRGGHDIENWAFGMTNRRRRPKPALAAVSRALSQLPFERDLDWPRMSVVVCTYNGERTIRDCLDGLLKLDYPDYEVIVVDDGSTDATAQIARQYPFRLITTENRGLSSARNTGFRAATGEIVAYIDDDAYPTTEWLKYLANTLMTTGHAAVGGPNLSPRTDGFIADCVALAPGGPIHVLLSDREAEHIPGCNMAIRKSCLDAIGGFDATFRVAGDDVDLCWRLQQYGWTLGFNASAVVWHHRRNSIRAYWRQQRGYGKAEALLEAKWPEKYNSSGHPAWAGRIYSPGFSRSLSRMKRIFHGVWGTAPYQSIYQPAPDLLSSISLVPEWYLLIGILALLSLIGFLWQPLLASFPLLIGAAGLTVTQATLRSKHACHLRRDRSRLSRFRSFSTTAFLYSLQPLARLFGRLRHGLHPWRRRGVRGWTWPGTRRPTIWSEHWRAPEEWLRAVESELRKLGTRVIRGGDYDRWDLEISDGTLGSVRLMSVVEEHGTGKQFVRFRLASRCSPWTLLVMLSASLLSVSAAWDGARLASGILAVFAWAFALRILGDSGLAMSTTLDALRTVEKRTDELNKAIENKTGERSRAAAAAVPTVISFRRADS